MLHNTCDSLNYQCCAAERAILGKRGGEGELSILGFRPTLAKF